MVGMEQFKDLWIQTARERIQSLSDLLLKLEKNPDDKTIIDELMRAGHSLKGESAAMGYEQIATLAHVIEDLFTGIGKGEIAMNPDIADQLLAAIDYITQAVDNIEGNQPEPDSKPISEKIKTLTGLKTEGFGKTDKSQSLTAQLTPSPPDGVDQALNSLGVVATQTTSPENPNNAPREIQLATPTPEPNAPSSAPAASMTPASTMPSSPAPSATPQSTIEPSASSTATIKATPKTVSTVTMKIEKLDQLLSVNEELVLLKMKLKNHQLVNENADLKAEIHRLDRLVTDMQFYLMQARLFPISMAIQTLPRLLRDTARKTNKHVRLEVEGEDTTVDRTIIDHLTEAFVHMIKNSVDHGIESPEQRKNAGKLEEGVVKIKAYTKENKFFCEVSDDGMGIEWDKLMRKAIEQGKITREETASWTEKDKQKLLFLDGVSASDVVTDVSGRGVGLGAVRQTITKLGGSMTVDTIVGEGTTFTLRLPMTLAIMQALLVRVGKQTFAMPGNEIIRSVQVTTDQVKSTGNMPAMVVDAISVPIIKIGEKFGIDEEKLVEPTSEPEIIVFSDPPTTAQPAADTLFNNKTVVLVRQGDDTIGCLVDKILAEEEILVKPLGPMLKHSNYFSGVTILADGSAAPIINFEGLRWKQSHN